MKDIIVKELARLVNLPKEQVLQLLQVPPTQELGDYAFPCFSLAKELKKSPVQIALELAVKIKSPSLEKVTANGPYINFFLNRNILAQHTLANILSSREKFGSSTLGKGKTLVVDLSAPNIAKPFGIGHLRSTIIGNAIANLYAAQGYRTVKINYLGDWGTQFGKLIVAYQKFGDPKKLKKDPIKYLLELYIEGNKEEYEEEARAAFKKLEEGDKKYLQLWKLFKSLSLKEFNKLYKLLNIKFDVISGESFYNNKMQETIELLDKKKLLVQSEGAQGVDLEKFGLGFCLIKKSDGATLYATRDITAAIDRQKKYKFDIAVYEVGNEQKLYFQQLFKVLELLGYSWAKNCHHVVHGLYLDTDGKKFATRQGKTVFMDEILNEVIALAKQEILKRTKKIAKTELEKRARAIALAAIFYGDLKNHRTGDIVFDLNRFVSFEGDTGPYLLYTYARAQSILTKAKYKPAKITTEEISQTEKNLIFTLSQFPLLVEQAAKNFSPNIIAQYAFQIAQKFNEFYHAEQVIGSQRQQFKLALVDAFSTVLNNALALLGINVLKKM